MFGSKDERLERLKRLERIVRYHTEGITQAELARQLNVMRSTINKDLGVIQQYTGALLWEDETGRLYWFR